MLSTHTSPTHSETSLTTPDTYTYQSLFAQLQISTANTIIHSRKTKFDDYFREECESRELKGYPKMKIWGKYTDFVDNHIENTRDEILNAVRSKKNKENRLKQVDENDRKAWEEFVDKNFPAPESPSLLKITFDSILNPPARASSNESQSSSSQPSSSPSSSSTRGTDFAFKDSHKPKDDLQSDNEKNTHNTHKTKKSPLSSPTDQTKSTSKSSKSNPNSKKKDIEPSLLKGVLVANAIKLSLKVRLLDSGSTGFKGSGSGGSRSAKMLLEKESMMASGCGGGVIYSTTTQA